MGFTVKKLFAFIALLTAVSMLTVATAGCSKKTVTSGTGTLNTSVPATTRVEAGK
jgi:hypothetical protein